MWSVSHMWWICTDSFFQLSPKAFAAAATDIEAICGVILKWKAGLGLMKIICRWPVRFQIADMVTNPARKNVKNSLYIFWLCNIMLLSLIPVLMSCNFHPQTRSECKLLLNYNLLKSLDFAKCGFWNNDMIYRGGSSGVWRKQRRWWFTACHYRRNRWGASLIFVGW